MSRTGSWVPFVGTRVLVSLLAMVNVASAWGAEPVYVALRSEVSVDSNPILLAHIADVLTEDALLKHELEQLDVLEVKPNAEAGKISQAHVSIRLRLAGFDSTQVRVVGAEMTQLDTSAVMPSSSPLIGNIASSQATLEKRIVEETARQLSELWSVARSRVVVSLLRPLPQEEAVEAANIDGVTVSVSATQSPGNLRPRVSLKSNGQLIAVWNLSVEALLVQDVVILRTPVATGDVLTAEHLEVAQRPLNSTSSHLRIDDAVGRGVRRDLPAGHLLRRHELTTPQSRNQALVSARDAVRIVVRKSGLTVVADGEALQSGNVGDRIRVRNTRSGKVLVGKLNTAGEVELLAR